MKHFARATGRLRVVRCIDSSVGSMYWTIATDLLISFLTCFKVKLFNRTRSVTVRLHVEIVKSKFPCRIQSEISSLKFYLTRDFVAYTLSSDCRRNPRQNPSCPERHLKLVKLPHALSDISSRKNNYHEFRTARVARGRGVVNRQRGVRSYRNALSAMLRTFGQGGFFYDRRDLGRKFAV